MFNRISERSRKNLIGVDERLVLLVGYVLAISDIDFFVSEGVRSRARQEKMYLEKKSKCDGVKKVSKHQLGKAIDIYYVGWKNSDATSDVRWSKLISVFKIAGFALGLELEFGYDWGWDNPHIELK